MVAPLRPHTTQRAELRKRSLDASMPHRIISGVSAMGALRKHSGLLHQTQTQGVFLRMSARVGMGPLYVR